MTRHPPERPTYDLADCSREFLEVVEENLKADVANGREDLRHRLDMVRAQIPKAPPYHVLYKRIQSHYV